MCFCVSCFFVDFQLLKHRDRTTEPGTVAIFVISDFSGPFCFELTRPRPCRVFVIELFDFVGPRIVWVVLPLYTYSYKRKDILLLKNIGSILYIALSTETCVS